MKLSYSSPPTRKSPLMCERIEVGRGVHVREEVVLELDAGGVEAGEHGAQAALAGLERGQRAPRDRARERAGLRDGGVAARAGQQRAAPRR